MQTGPLSVLAIVALVVGAIYALAMLLMPLFVWSIYDHIKELKQSLPSRGLGGSASLPDPTSDIELVHSEIAAVRAALDDLQADAADTALTGPTGDIELLHSEIAAVRAALDGLQANTADTAAVLIQMRATLNQVALLVAQAVDATKVQ